jgi:hypothetical protein
MSRLVKINDTKWEDFTFNLFFLCTANTTNNQIKSLDKDTNTSSSRPWNDWSDMKQCAVDFLDILMQVIQTKSSPEGTRLGALMNVEFDKTVIRRLTKFNNDQLSGVSMTFTVLMFTDTCTLKDYPTGALSSITVPALNYNPIVVDPGTLPGGRYDSNFGVSADVPEGYGMIQFDLVNITQVMAVWIDNRTMLVDFGDGPKTYPINVGVVKTYPSGTNQTIKIYHHNDINTLSVMDDYGGTSADDMIVTGTIPDSVNKIAFGDHMHALPALPAGMKDIGLSLTTEKLDDLLDSLIANGIMYGRLSILTDPKTYADTNRLNALQSKGWDIIAWGFGDVA